MAIELGGGGYFEKVKDGGSEVDGGDDVIGIDGA